MLRRIYIDNYKAFSNFSFEPGEFQLIHGCNGAGKTSLFECIDLLRGFVVDGLRTDQVFPAKTRTRWDRREIQSFEIEVEGNGGRYAYRLEIDHHLATKRCRVRAESLKFDGRPLFLFETGEVRLFRDDHSEGAKYSLDWALSGLGSVPARRVNTRLTWFKGWLERAYFLHINPVAMSSETDEDNSRLARDASNFASWYQHLSQEKAERLPAFFKEIEEVLGIASLILKKAGEETRTLLIRMRPAANDPASEPLLFGLDELSDGQRLLIVLYTMIHFAVEPGALIAIDDPVNFIAIAEVQPWIASLVDRAEEVGAQVMLISHHPEIIDYMIPDRVVHLVREPTGPVRVKDFIADQGSGLKASELVARGWDDE